MSTSSSRTFRGVSLFVGGLLALSIWAAPGLSAQTSTSADEATSTAAINAARADAGAATLARDAGLDSVARTHAERMAAADAIFHNPNVKPEADAAGVAWQWIGENVGVGPTAQDVHTGFMNSDGHRANLLYAGYNVIGAGVAHGPDGSLFVVHVFAYVEPAAQLQPQPEPAIEVAAVEPTLTEEPAAPAPTEAAPTPAVLAQPVVSSQEPAPSDTGPNVLIGGVVNQEIVVSGS